MIQIFAIKHYLRVSDSSSDMHQFIHSVSNPMTVTTFGLGVTENSHQIPDAKSPELIVFNPINIFIYLHVRHPNQREIIRLFFSE